MEKTVGIKVEVDSKQASKSLGDLETEFERLNEEIRKVPINSKEFKELNAQIAQTGREVKNLELSMESLDNEQVASELGSVAGAVGDVSAAFILLGDDSETMQEVAKNIEFAMGLSMGLKGAIEGVSSANKLLTNSTIAQNVVEKISNFLKTGAFVTNAQLAASEAARASATVGATAATSAATAGMKLFRLALIATGIGAIVVLIGLLIANFDKVTNAVMAGVNMLKKAYYQFQNLGAGVKIVLSILFPFIGIIYAIAEALEYLGVIESQEQMKQREIFNEKSKQIKAEYKEKASHYKKIQELLKESLEAERKSVAEKGKLIDWEIKKREAAGESTSALELEKINMLIESTKKEIELKQQIINAQFQEAAARTQANIEIAKLQGQNTKTMEFELKKQKELARSFQDDELKTLVDNLDNQQKELEIFNIKQEKIKSDAAKKRNEEEKKLYDENVIERAKRRKTESIALIEEEKNYYLDYMALVQKAAQEQAEIEEAARQAKLEKQKEDLQNSANLISSLTTLNNTAMEAELEMAGNNEAKKQEIRKKAFARDKALKIAEATITGIQAVQSALASPFPFNIALAAINGATALANIVKIANTKFDGSTGGGSAPSSLGNTSAGSGGANVGQVTNTTTTIGEPTKVYVTEQDISNTQNKVSVNEAQATVG